MSARIRLQVLAVALAAAGLGCGGAKKTERRPQSSYLKKILSLLF